MQTNHHETPHKEYTGQKFHLLQATSQGREKEALAFLAHWGVECTFKPCHLKG